MPICSESKPRTRDRNTGVRNTVQNRPMPVMNDKRLPMPKLRIASALRSTIGSLAVNACTRNRKPQIAEIHVQNTITSSPNQFLRGPSSSTYSRHPRKPDISAMPT